MRSRNTSGASETQHCGNARRFLMFDTLVKPIG